MAGQQALITETDGPDGDDGQGFVPAPGQSVPDGLSDRTAGRQGGSVQRAREPEQQFEIVDTDDDFNPIGGDQQQVQPPPQDRRLADDQGDGTLLDQRRRQQDQQQPKPRESRRERHDRQRQARDRTQAELADARAEIENLRAAVNGFAPKFDEIDQNRLQQRVAEVDREIGEATARRQHAARRMQEAITAGDGGAIIEAMEERDNATIAFTQATARKNLLTTGVPTGNAADRPFVRQQPQQQPQLQPQPQRQAPDPFVQARLRDFAAENQWFRTGPNGEPLNADTDIAQAIDRGLVADGFRPNTDDYWDELRDRLEDKGLIQPVADPEPRQPPAPRRAAAPAQQRDNVRQLPPPEQRGPRVAGGSDRGPSASNPTKVHLSPARKEAMIQSGVLDRDGRTVVNKDKFQRQMRAFAEFDRANGVGRA